MKSVTIVSTAALEILKSDDELVEAAAHES